jgi:hypothetical protein
MKEQGVASVMVRYEKKELIVSLDDAKTTPDALGIWHWLRGDEADCSTYRRRHDHFDHPRPDFGSGLLRHDEGTRFTERTPLREESNYRCGGHHMM